MGFYRNYWNVVVKNEYILCVFIFFVLDKLGLEIKIFNDIFLVLILNVIILRLKDIKDDYSFFFFYKFFVNFEIFSISVEVSDFLGVFYGI